MRRATARVSRVSVPVGPLTARSALASKRATRAAGQKRQLSSAAAAKPAGELVDLQQRSNSINLARKGVRLLISIWPFPRPCRHLQACGLGQDRLVLAGLLLLPDQLLHGPAVEERQV